MIAWTLLVASLLGSAWGQSTDIRLVGGSTPSSGRLEVRINGLWGTVCDFTGLTFTKTEADLACRQLQGSGQAANYGNYILYV